MLSEDHMGMIGAAPRALAWGAPMSNSFASNMTVVDKVPPELLHLVDPHWYQFPPMNPMWHALIGFFIGVIGLVSFIGNGMVIYIFSSTKSLRTPSNMLVVNLAFSDFLMIISMAPTMVVACYYETWIFGVFMCEMHAMLGSIFGNISIWTMVMIAVDRYNVIVKGLSAKPLTNKSVALRILAIWTNALIWTIFPMFGWNRYVPEGNMTACGTDYLSKDWLSRSYILVYATFVYYTPLCVIIYSYFYIVQAVAHHEKQMREQAKKMNVASLRSSEASQTSAECKLAKIAMMTIALWFFAWTPYMIINFMGVFEGSAISPLTTIWGSVFAKANAVYNPIVYGISHPKYRAVLMKKFPSLACAPPPAEAETSSTASGVTNITDENKPNA